MASLISPEQAPLMAGHVCKKLPTALHSAVEWYLLKVLPGLLEVGSKPALGLLQALYFFSILLLSL